MRWCTLFRLTINQVISGRISGRASGNTRSSVKTYSVRNSLVPERVSHVLLYQDPLVISVYLPGKYYSTPIVWHVQKYIAVGHSWYRCYRSGFTCQTSRQRQGYQHSRYCGQDFFSRCTCMHVLQNVASKIIM